MVVSVSVICDANVYSLTIVICASGERVSIDPDR